MTTDEAIFTWDDDPAQHEPFVVCANCGAKLCTVEEGDSLATIAAVVRGHDASECDGLRAS